MSRIAPARLVHVTAFAPRLATDRDHGATRRRPPRTCLLTLGALLPVLVAGLRRAVLLCAVAGWALPPLAASAQPPASRADAARLGGRLDTDFGPRAPRAEADPIQNFLLQREEATPRLRTDASPLPFIPEPAPPAPAPAAAPSPAPLPPEPPLAAEPPRPAPPAPLLPLPTPPASSATADAAAAEAIVPPSAPSAAAVVQPGPPPAPASRPRDAESPLGVGDQVAVTVFGQPDLSAEVTVSESGLIMLPLIGSLNVLSLTPGQLERQVAQRLKDGGFLLNPAVAVQVRQVRSQLVSVMGEVQRPGRYPIQGRMTVLEALATAGGLTPRADRQISLLRKTRAADGSADAGAVREEIKISLDAIGGPTAGQADAELRNDDVILVGVQKQFYVHGQVRRPGAYPLEPGMNVMKALALGGGVTERGSVRRIRIHREAIDGSGVKEHPAELTTPVQANDVIYVEERLF